MSIKYFNLERDENNPMGIRELSMNEIDHVSGGDIGGATVQAGIAGGGAGWNVVRGAS